MNCENLGLFMAKFYDNLLTEDERRELGIHLGICGKCRKRSQDMLPALICMQKYLENGLDEKKEKNFERNFKDVTKHDLQKIVYDMVSNINI